jgi:hypothetical protein
MWIRIKATGEVGEVYHSFDGDTDEATYEIKVEDASRAEGYRFVILYIWEVEIIEK